MVTFEAKAIMNIPANRLIAFGGINSNGDPEEGWETVYLQLSKKGWIPDLVTHVSIDKDDLVKVSVLNNPVWKAEAAQDLPAGTLVQCDDEGRVKSYSVEDGNFIGYTLHSVKSGEVASFVRKYGGFPPAENDDENGDGTG